MGRYKTLTVNILLFACNTIATKLISFILIPLYTYYMTTGEFGVTDIATTLTNLLYSLITLQVAEGVLRFTIEDKKHQKEYVTIGFGITAVSCIIVAILLPGLTLNVFGGLNNYRWQFLMLYVASAFQWYFGIVARGLNQIKLIPISSSISAVVSALLAYLLIAVMHQGANGFFFSTIVGSLVGALIFLIFGKQYLYITNDILKYGKKYAKQVLVYSLPLVPNALSWWLNTNVNRFFIVSMMGIGVSGLFAAACKIPNFMNIVSQIFLSAWTLSAFQEYKKDNIARFYSTVFKFLHVVGSVLASALILCAPLISSVMLQKEFYSAWILIPVIVLSVMYNIYGSFYASIYTSSMKTTFLFVTTAVGAIVTTALTPLLLMVIGVQGAGIAMCLGNFTLFILRVINSKKILYFKINIPVVCYIEILLIIQVVFSVLQIPVASWVISITVFMIVLIVGCCRIYPDMRKLFKKRKTINI